MAVLDGVEFGPGFRRLQGHPEVEHIRGTIGLWCGQHPVDELSEVCVDLGTWAVGQQLGQQDHKRFEVGLRVDRPGPALSGSPEVGQEDCAVCADEDVRGTQRTVGDPRPVGGLEHPGHGIDQGDDVVGVEVGLSIEEAVEGRRIDPFGHDHGEAVMVGDVEHGGDAGEGEMGGTGGDIAGVDEFHGDGAFEHGIVSCPHLGACRAAEEFVQAIPGGDDRPGCATARVLQCHRHRR